MSLWERWKKNRIEASRWDDPAPGNVRILYLKRILRAAPREGARADDLLWQRLRRQLKPLGSEVPAVQSIFIALASMGPRFAVAAAAVLIFSIGLQFLPGPAPAPNPPRPAAQAVSLESSASLFPEAMETRSGDDLLAFITYDQGR